QSPPVTSVLSRRKSGSVTVCGGDAFPFPAKPIVYAPPEIATIDESATVPSGGSPGAYRRTRTTTSTTAITLTEPANTGTNFDRFFGRLIVLPPGDVGVRMRSPCNALTMSDALWNRCSGSGARQPSITAASSWGVSFRIEVI